MSGTSLTETAGFRGRHTPNGDGAHASRNTRQKPGRTPPAGTRAPAGGDCSTASRPCTWTAAMTAQPRGGCAPTRASPTSSAPKDAPPAPPTGPGPRPSGRAGTSNAPTHGCRLRATPPQHRPPPLPPTSPTRPRHRLHPHRQTHQPPQPLEPNTISNPRTLFNRDASAGGLAQALSQPSSMVTDLTVTGREGSPPRLPVSTWRAMIDCSTSRPASAVAPNTT